MIEDVVKREFGVRCEVLTPDTMRARLLAWPHPARFALWDGTKLHVSTDVVPGSIDDDWAWVGFTPLTPPAPEKLAQVFEAVPTGALGLAFIEPVGGGEGYHTRALYFRVRQGKLAA